MPTLTAERWSQAVERPRTPSRDRRDGTPEPAAPRRSPRLRSTGPYACGTRTRRRGSAGCLRAPETLRGSRGLRPRGRPLSERNSPYAALRKCGSSVRARSIPAKGGRSLPRQTPTAPRSRSHPHRLGAHRAQLEDAATRHWRGSRRAEGAGPARIERANPWVGRSTRANNACAAPRLLPADG